MMEDTQGSGDGWEFFMGEVVQVGEQQGTIVGRNEHVAHQDHFVIAVINADGFASEITLPQYAVAHTLKH